MSRTFFVWALTFSLLGRGAVAQSPTPASPLTAMETLTRLRNTYDTRFNSAAVYWGVGGALIATGGLTLGLSPIREPTPNGRLALISGSATIVSGLSSCFSALPLTMAPPALAERIAKHGGNDALTESLAYSILAEQAAWARNWRISVLVVTTVLLAVNAGALTWYAVNNEYQRVTTAVIAGLYGLGVVVVPFYDMIPWVEETTFDSLKSPGASAPVSALRILPGLVTSPTGMGLALNVTGAW